MALSHFQQRLLCSNTVLLQAPSLEHWRHCQAEVSPVMPTMKLGTSQTGVRYRPKMTSLNPVELNLWNIIYPLVLINVKLRICFANSVDPE